MGPFLEPILPAFRRSSVELTAVWYTVILKPIKIYGSEVVLMPKAFIIGIKIETDLERSELPCPDGGRRILQKCFNGWHRWERQAVKLGK